VQLSAIGCLLRGHKGDPALARKGKKMGAGHFSACRLSVLGEWQVSFFIFRGPLYFLRSDLVGFSVVFRLLAASENAPRMARSPRIWIFAAKERSAASRNQRAESELKICH
jgi:hypothetical protein